MPTYYADDAMVTELAHNVKSTITPTRLAIYKRIVDSQIDAALSAIYVDWDLVKDDTIPEQIIVMASHLVAAQLEMVKYSVNEAGGVGPNPYGLALRDTGMNMLTSIMNGDIIVPGLTRFGPHSTEAAEGTFEPVGALRAQGFFDGFFNQRS